jgi:hypothetical protein
MRSPQIADKDNYFYLETTKFLSVPPAICWACSFVSGARCCSKGSHLSRNLRNCIHGQLVGHEATFVYHNLLGFTLNDKIVDCLLDCK